MTDAVDRRPGLLARLFMRLVRGYQVALSPYLGRNCRFTPTCSAYALDALRTHSLPRALALATWRLLRCNPFCRGGYDPVPPAKKER
jgi:hypothetical protein